MILGGANMESELARVILPGACLDQARLGPAMRFRGTVPKDSFMISYAAECPQEGQSFNFGTKFGSGSIGFYTPGETTDSKTPEGYRNATLTISEEAFHELLASQFPECAPKLSRGGKFMNLDPETCRQLDTLLASIAGVIRQAPESLVCGIVRSELEREVFDRFFDLFRRADGQSDHFTQRIPRRHLRWKQASDFIEANNRRPIRIEELCTITGLSRRGLEYLFMDFSGISAGNYLLKRRLHGLRRELLDAEPFHGEVKRCALTWGFWHLGRLASDYRRCFGEYPKATLCRKMSCAS